jgi:hypothetical protein
MKFFSTFLTMYYTHPKQFDVLQNDNSEIIERNLRKGEKKKGKIVLINFCNDYWGLLLN